MNKQRNSNIEMLRILSIIGITFYHNSVWGGYSFEGVTINKIVVDVFSMFGKVGVNIFVIIMGYYSVGRQFDCKRIIKMELQTLFYSWLLLIVSMLFLEVTLKDIVKSIFPNIFGDYWFSSAFIIWYILSPFIHKLCSFLKKQQLELMILICMIIWCVIPTISLKPANYGVTNYMWFPIMYIIGIYLKQYASKWEVNYGLIVLLFVVLQIGSAIITNLVGGKFIEYSTYFRNGNSITTVILSIAVFMYFLKMRERNNRIINKLAVCVFPIYLIQEHVLFRGVLWHEIFKVSTLQDTSMLPIMLWMDMICLYVVGFLTCVVYEKIEKVLLPIVYHQLNQKKLHKAIKILEDI